MNIDADVRAFLDREPGLLAAIGTHGRDGYPLLVPVWFRFDGERIVIWSDETRRWVKNLRRDPRAGVSIQEQSPPQMAVMMRGDASVETGEGPGFDAEIRRIVRRYVPGPEVEGYVAEWPGLQSIVRITPRRVFVWR